MKNPELKTLDLIVPEMKNELSVQISEEKQVILHCSMKCEGGIKVRIWKTTYLITEKGKRIPLLFWEGISLFPEWTPIYYNGTFNFTLIFSGLASDCKVFSLVEEIHEPGGFYVSNIRRNNKDVYHVEL
jgi:hypothetical protein